MFYASQKKGAGMTVTTGETLDTGAIIDAQPIGRAQVWLILACAAVLFVDGFDTQAIGYVAPAVAKDLGLTRAALGPVFSAGLFGLMLGALVIGPVADRAGRRRCIVASTAVFGVFALLTALADGRDSLIALRFLTGLGLGGAMPNAIALTAEYSPHRRRATLVMLMFAGFSVGAALGGLIAAAILPVTGWRGVFVLGGVLPLLLTPVLAWRLPESARFLATTPAGRTRLRPLLQHVFPSADLPDGLIMAEPALPGLTVGHLFRERRTVMTALFWVIFFASLLDLYFLSNWLPTVLTDLGASVSLAAVLGSMLQVGGLTGVLVLGRLVDRLSFRALALTYLGAAVAVAAVGQATSTTLGAGVAIFCAGFGIVGGQTAANALVATSYPTGLRATGVGWALGIGRIGSIVGPLIGGALLAMHWGEGPLFLLAAIPALAASFAALLLARRNTA